jgi:hypothetical protein
MTVNNDDQPVARKVQEREKGQLGNYISDKTDASGTAHLYLYFINSVLGPPVEKRKKIMC